MIRPTEQDRCDLAAEALRINGTLTLKAFGTSMIPALWPGDLVCVQSCGFSDVQPGDIALCRREHRFFLHRVTQKLDESWLITRGDSMPGTDPRISPQDLIGRVTRVQHGNQDFVPIRKFSLRARLIGRILGHSNICMRLAMKFRGPFPPMTNPALGDIAR